MSQKIPQENNYYNNINNCLEDRFKFWFTREIKGKFFSSLNFPLIVFENGNWIYKYWFTRNSNGDFKTSLWSPLKIEIEYKKYWFTRNFKGDFWTSLWSPLKIEIKYINIDLQGISKETLKLPFDRLLNPLF